MKNYEMISITEQEKANLDIKAISFIPVAKLKELVKESAGEDGIYVMIRLNKTISDISDSELVFEADVEF